MADGLYENLQNKIKSEPDNPYHYSDLALLYWQVDEALDLAQKTLEAGLAAVPDDMGLRSEYAYFLGKSGRNVSKARQIFTDLLSAPQVDSRTLSQAAEFFWQVAGDLEMANKLYSQAVAKDQEDEILRGHYADFLWRGLGNGPRAKEVFDQAFKIGPIDDEAVLAAFATFLWQSENQIELAAKYFKRAMNEEPEQEWIYAVYKEFKDATGR